MMQGKMLTFGQKMVIFPIHAHCFYFQDHLDKIYHL